MKAYVNVVGTHWNCLHKLRQFKWVPYEEVDVHGLFEEVDVHGLYEEVDVHGLWCCTWVGRQKMLDCALIGVCAVIRSNTVICAPT